MRTLHGAVICFSFTDRNSFDHLARHIEDCKKHCPENAQFIIAGLKADASDRFEVTIEKAQDFAADRSMSFLTASALEDYNVEELFTMSASLCLSDWTLVNSTLP